MALTRTTQQSEQLTLNMPQQEAFAALVTAIGSVGKVKSQQQAFGRIVGKVRSGHANMNKADLTVQVEPLDEVQTKVSFHATAQEGLVSQNTAAKAITRVLDGLPAESVLPPDARGTPIPTPAPGSLISASEEIARLAALHKDGALTDEEFTAAKAKVLG
jgi:hypothetical protein